MTQFVIVGGGLAAHNAAIRLRQLDATASITLIGDEALLPYNRPPLSKEFLVGRTEVTDIHCKGVNDYEDLQIDFLLGTSVISLDRIGKSVTTERGEIIHYDALLLATGSRPRRFPTAEANNSIHYLRTVDDATRLRRELSPGRHVIIVGGGFVGLEVSSAALSLGCRVTLIEASTAFVSRSLPSMIGRYLQRLHHARGAEVLLGESVRQIYELDIAQCRVVTVADNAIDGDIVVAGIGVIPNVELAAQAGLIVDDGIVVDSHCRTSDPCIFAAGEVTSHPTGRNGQRCRIESWQIAAKQSLVAASSMAGVEETFDEPAWLWSDQFDVNIQVIGSPSDGCNFLVHSDEAPRRWTLLALDRDQVPTGAVAINNGRDISRLRQTIRARQTLPQAILSDFRPLNESKELIEGLRDSEGSMFV